MSAFPRVGSSAQQVAAYKRDSKRSTLLYELIEVLDEVLEGTEHRPSRHTFLAAKNLAAKEQQDIVGRWG